MYIDEELVARALSSEEQSIFNILRDKVEQFKGEQEETKEEMNSLPWELPMEEENKERVEWGLKPLYNYEIFSPDYGIESKIYRASEQVDVIISCLGEEAIKGKLEYEQKTDTWYLDGHKVYVRKLD